MTKRNQTIEEHYRKYNNTLVKITSAKFGGNRAYAEDAIQEAYCRALKYFHCYNPLDKPFHGWFSTILKNCVRDMKKDMRTQGVVEYSDNQSDIDDDSLRERRDLAIDLHNFMIENYRGGSLEVLILFYFHNLKSKEISMLVDNMSDGNVRQVIWKFRNAFKGYYGYD